MRENDMSIKSEGECQTNATKTNDKPVFGWREMSSTDSMLSARSEASPERNCSLIFLPNMIVERLETEAKSRRLTVSEFVEQLLP